jgi:hypothetical protein
VLVINYRNQSGALVNEVLESDGGLVCRGHGTLYTDDFEMQVGHGLQCGVPVLPQCRLAADHSFRLGHHPGRNRRGEDDIVVEMGEQRIDVVAVLGRQPIFGERARLWRAHDLPFSDAQNGHWCDSSKLLMTLLPSGRNDIQKLCSGSLFLAGQPGWPVAFGAPLATKWLQ